MDYTKNQGYNGLSASQDRGINLKSSLEDFLKIEYTEGLRNEFAVMDALINSIAKDTVTGKKKYKSFALGIQDNVRGLGIPGVNSDLYEIEIGDFMKAADTVDAEFDTTKLIGVFSITDETLLKSSTDGSLFDVLSDTLDRMQMGLKHTMNRYTYGSHTGRIGIIKTVESFADAANANPGVQTGNKKITDDIISVEATNSMSLLPGMGVMIKAGTKFRQGRIWQKDDTTSFGKEKLIIVLDKEVTGDATVAEITAAAGTAELYARQMVKGQVAEEYHGLEDIVVTQNNKLFGVDRNVYRSLNCSKKDMQGELLTESDLRDMADHIALTGSSDTGVNLVCAKHAIIATLEKQMYQFKQYSIDAGGNGFQLGGRSNIRFDNYELRKDKYARDNNVYLLDTTKIGELLRKDFGWITSGRETILERRDGSEVYEAIMTKYADMYIDAWRAHACFTNVKDNIGSAGLYARQVSVVNPVKTEAAAAAATPSTPPVGD